MSLTGGVVTRGRSVKIWCVWAALHCGATNTRHMDRLRCSIRDKHDVELHLLSITKARSCLVWIILNDAILVNKHILFRILSGYKPIPVLNIVPLYGANDVEVHVHGMVSSLWEESSSSGSLHSTAVASLADEGKSSG